jgi:hypothetical protein
MSSRKTRRLRIIPAILAGNPQGINDAGLASKTRVFRFRDEDGVMDSYALLSTRCRQVRPVSRRLNAVSTRRLAAWCKKMIKTGGTSQHYLWMGTIAEPMPGTMVTVANCIRQAIKWDNPRSLQIEQPFNQGSRHRARHGRPFCRSGVFQTPIPT